MEDDSGIILNPEILDEIAELSDLSILDYQNFPAIGHDNRPSNTRARKGVIYEPNESQSSSLPSGKQRTPQDDTESTEYGGGIIVNSDIILLDETAELSDLSKFYYQNFPAISHDKTSTADLRTQDSYSSVKQERHNSTATSVTAHSRHRQPLHTTYGVNGSPEELNLLFQSPDLGNDLNTTDTVVPVVFVVSTFLVVFMFAVFFYRRRSEFCKWTYFKHYKYNKQMDNLLDDTHV
jgi:hypothetical protein